MEILLILVLLLVALFIFYYNRIITLENRVNNALSQVDVQLKRRNDLIPNLVNTVKGYAAHETGVFDRVTQARERMLSAGSIEEKSAASNQLTQALRSVFAIAEATPSSRPTPTSASCRGSSRKPKTKLPTPASSSTTPCWTSTTPSLPSPVCLWPSRWVRNQSPSSRLKTRPVRCPMSVSKPGCSVHRCRNVYTDTR